MMQLGKFSRGSRKFDEASGLEYTETTAPIRILSDSGWNHRADLFYHAHRTQSDDIPDLIGTRSLEDTAISLIARNISDIKFEAISFLPIRLIQKIWTTLSQEGKVSLHAFTIFSRALVKNIKTLDLLRYRAQIHHYNPPLSVYITPLSSKSFSFLTILSITTCVSVVDLVKLSSATNLVALEIVPPVIDRGTGVNDRLVRTWSESCEQEQAFPVLRILRLRNHLDLTRQSLQYINKFPVLALYDIGRCDFSSESPIRDLWAGWKCVMYHDVLGQMETTCVERRRAMQEKLGNGSFRTQTLISQHLTNATEVKWLPRDRLPEFLTGRQDTIKTTSTQEHISPPSQTFRYSSSPEQLQEITAYMEPWDSNLQKLVDRIGELRNDHDFRTVMHLENQAIMGNDLINSYPMVSFRLGSSQLEFNTQVEVTELAFIRISLDNVSTPADRNLALGDAQSDRDSQSIRWETKSDRHANPNTKPMKRKPPGIKSKKRRKLEDVLKSFS